MIAQNKQRYIMVIEDSPEDFDVLERGFRKAEILIPLHHYHRSMDALDALMSARTDGDRHGGDDRMTKPALIMLDLNMPGMDGFDVLGRLKSDGELRLIPVVVLSTSKSETDISKAYAAGANAFLSKPVDTSGYVRMAGIIKTFWFECAILPE